MDKINLTKFDEISSLSCVESYLLFIFDINNIEYKHLYSQSFISFNDLSNDFINRKAKYAFYDGVPRLQETACQYKLIDMESFNSPYINSICETNTFLVIKIKPSFIEKKYGITMWRDDHYMLIVDCSDEYWTCVNDNPRDIIRMTKSEVLSSLYNGKQIIIKLLGGITTEIKRSFLNDFRNGMSKQKKVYKIDQIPNEISIRDMIGVLRVLRRRLFEYCSLYFECNFMHDYIKNLDKTYSMIEYLRLRGKLSDDKLQKMIMNIEKKDSELVEIIKEKMKGVYYEP